MKLIMDASHNHTSSSSNNSNNTDIDRNSANNNSNYHLPQPSNNNSSSSSMNGRSLLDSLRHHHHNNNNKNLYGSSQDLMNASSHLRNHQLTTQLVQAKQDWEALQKSFRANTHGRFVYQTTLARIVSHVQDFAGGGGCGGDSHDDPEMVRLVQDLVQWMHDCEHIECPSIITGNSSGGGGIDDENIIQSLHNKNTSLTTDDNDSSAGKKGGSKRRSSGSNSSTNRTPIIDYNDVQPFLDTSTVPIFPSFLKTHHESLQEQNDMLEQEIAKWQSSMARIRLCNRREAAELLCHQKTLRKVVERIQNCSNFQYQDQVLLWYDQCQKEAERCGSFSEQEAAQCCQQCHSKLSNNDDDAADSDQECIEDDEKDNAVQQQQHHHHVHHDLEPKVFDCPATPSTVDTAGLEDSTMVHVLSPIPSPTNTTTTKMTQTTDGPPSPPHPTATEIAAANVEDPPDRISPRATNLQSTNIVQDKTAAAAAVATGHSKCGPACCIM
jgi:hypothetical protein